MNIDTLVVDGR